MAHSLLIHGVLNCFLWKMPNIKLAKCTDHESDNLAHTSAKDYVAVQRCNQAQVGRTNTMHGCLADFWNSISPPRKG